MFRKHSPEVHSVDTKMEDYSSSVDTMSDEPRSPPPSLPNSWWFNISQILENPGKHGSVMIIMAVRKISGIYRCRGLKNRRPYYEKESSDIAMWYDNKESIWVLAESKALNDEDLEVFGCIYSTAWDVTLIPKEKYWFISDVTGEWREDKSMRVVRYLSTDSSDPRDKFLSREHQSVFSDIYHEMNEFRSEMIQQKMNLETIAKQLQMRTKRDEFNSRLTSLEESGVIKRLEKLERLVTRKHSPKRKRGKAHAGWTFDDFISQGKIEDATKVIMKDWLKKKKQEGVTLRGRNIKVSGTKATLLKNIREILKQNQPAC